MKEICPGAGEPGLVSVILPTYNRAYIIDQTIESVIAQSYKPIEIIVIDDGSTDNTAEVLARFKSQIKYVRQANTGAAGARNTALGIARGEFIAMIDSDDQWEPWKLELQVAFLRKHPEVGMVWTDMTAIDANGAVVAPAYLRTYYRAHRQLRIEDVMKRAGTVGDLQVAVPHELRPCPIYVGDIFTSLIRGNLVHTPTTMLRRETARGTRGYNESLRQTGEDFDFHLRTTVQSDAGFLDVPTIRYRVGHPDQLTAPALNLAMARAYLKTVEFWLAQQSDRFAMSDAEQASILDHAHEWVGEQALLAGELSDARRHLRESLHGSRIRSKPYVMLALAALPRPVFKVVRMLRHRLRAARN